jgi:hypothetical protein
MVGLGGQDCHPAPLYLLRRLTTRRIPLLSLCLLIFIVHAPSLP